MPYIIEKRGDQHCVKSTDSGKTHGCHDTRADAIKQQRALYKNAPPGEEAAKAAAVMTGLATENDFLIFRETLKNVRLETEPSDAAAKKRNPVKDVLLRMTLQHRRANRT